MDVAESENLKNCTTGMLPVQRTGRIDMGEEGMYDLLRRCDPTKARSGDRCALAARKKVMSHLDSNPSGVAFIPPPRRGRAIPLPLEERTLPLDIAAQNDD